MYTIDKEFHFEYGHRVWNQTLNQEYCATGDNKCACRHLHGHSGKVTVYANAVKLESGMVTDFKHLGWIKDFIDTYLDHKFIVDINDPLLVNLTGLNFEQQNDGLIFQTAGMLSSYRKHHDTNPIRVTRSGVVTGWTLVTDEFTREEREYYESFFFVDFLPTSENMTKWLHGLANEKMNKIGVNVSRVDWSETMKSRASYAT